MKFEIDIDTTKNTLVNEECYKGMGMTEAEIIIDWIRETLQVCSDSEHAKLVVKEIKEVE